MQKKHVAGLSLAVIKNGKIVKAKGYGLANVETNTPATAETVYKIASISKQFFAAGILLLVKEGKLHLDDKVSTYLDGAPATWKAITIRHLLTHTAGLVEDPPGFEPYKLHADADVIKSAYATPLLFAPGENFRYSNLGYFVLGEVIHKVSGKAWSEFLAEHLFATAAMTATRITTTTDIVPHRANGYRWSKDQLENAENWVAVRPSGAFLSTVLDMAKWDAALASDSVLSSALKEQMWTSVKLNNGTAVPYGFGWGLTPWQGHKRVFHNGGLPGFLSDLERFPEDKLTVIVMSNTTSADPGQIALKVAGFYVPALAQKPIADSEPEITTKVKTMLSGFVDDTLDLNLFIPALVPWLNEGGRSGMSHAFRKPGGIRSIALIERTPDGDNRVYLYRLSYPDDSLLLHCTFNKDNKIIEFGIQDE